MSGVDPVTGGDAYVQALIGQETFKEVFSALVVVIIVVMMLSAFMTMFGRILSFLAGRSFVANMFDQFKVPGQAMFLGGSGYSGALPTAQRKALAAAPLAPASEQQQAAIWSQAGEGFKLGLMPSGMQQGYIEAQNEQKRHEAMTKRQDEAVALAQSAGGRAIDVDGDGYKDGVEVGGKTFSQVPQSGGRFVRITPDGQAYTNSDGSYEVLNPDGSITTTGSQGSTTAPSSSTTQPEQPAQPNQGTPADPNAPTPPEGTTPQGSTPASTKPEGNTNPTGSSPSPDGNSTLGGGDKDG